MNHAESHTAFSAIVTGDIYYFKSDRLKHTSESHYFIVVSRTNDEFVIFVCCTSKFESRRRFIELNCLPLSTLVWVKPNKQNGLTKDTYIDCNTAYPYSKSELLGLFNSGVIKFKGKLGESELLQLKQGVNESPMIPEDLKELI